MSEQWRELIRCDSLAEAHVVVLSIEAMEFDVRLRSAFSDEPLDATAIAGEPGAGGPFVIEVRGLDRDDLAGVLDEIIAEQGEFDELLARRDRAIERARWTLLWVLLAGAAVLVAYLVLREA